MTEFKNNIYVYSSFILIIFGFGIMHINKVNRSFYQLQYQWDKINDLKTYKIHSIDKLDYNKLIINLSSSINLDYQNTYYIEKDKKYYFRFNYSIKDNNQLQLLDLVWINEIPNEFTNVNKITMVDLPLKNNPSYSSIAMIGDDLIYYYEAKYLRKEIKQLKKITFLGDHKDLYSNAFYKIEDIKNISENQIEYIIVFSKSYPPEIYKQLQDILSDKPIQLIVVNVPKKLNIPYTNFDNKQIQPKLTPITIDLTSEFDKRNDLYYYENNTYLTYDAYKKIAELISKNLK